MPRFQLAARRMPKLRLTGVVVGRVQAGRAGLGWGEAPRFWSKAHRKERKEMVVAEVMRMEEDRYKIKAVSQGQGHSLSSEPSPVVWERRMLLTLPPTQASSTFYQAARSRFHRGATDGATTRS